MSNNRKKTVIFLAFVSLVLLTIILAGFVITLQRKQTQKPSKKPNVNLKTQYENPFDKKTQYVNPFSQYKNPFNNLR
ncbi:hypothetical protein HYT33_03905 [Candidatus Roizmanbacteria bacterium]|nr:hypothetical protein [Candidatus Roizmanbacteria bacterium]